MNHVTKTLIDIIKERFAHDKSYLAEKMEELDAHENKFDGLNFLCTKADSTTIKMYAERTKLTVKEIGFLKDIWHKI